MEPRIETLTFARYRAFRDEQTVKLGRLTLVYGENNAGKSALLRLPALLAVSRTPGEPGLTLAGSFRDVQWRGSIPAEENRDLILGVGIGEAEWRWTLAWQDLRATAYLADVSLQVEGVQIPLPTVDTFDGLIPPSVLGVADARASLSHALNRVIWIKALREAPSREGTVRGTRGTFGRTWNAASYEVAADPKLRAAVAQWYQANARVFLKVEALGGELERITLGPVGANHAVPFPDAGLGLQQVFAVVAALEHLREKGGLLCVEEPESHLHPRLQQALAELVVDVLDSQPDASVVLETHSEIFLLAALQATVGKLASVRDDVSLSWVAVEADGAAHVEPIALDEAGRPESDRLEQAFAVMGTMRRDLLQARKSHGG